MTDIDKSVLRKKYRSLRNSIENTQELSDKIFLLISNSDIYKNADTVLVYWSVESEVDTHKLVLKALEDNKRVALPKCIDKCGTMKFYYVTSFSDLSEGMYGIKEPAVCFPVEDFSENTLCLVPGLSFDAYGYRLGYGKGYYDRFLSSFSGISAGLCYENCLIKSLPKDEFDKKVNYIVTNIKIYELT